MESHSNVDSAVVVLDDERVMVEVLKSFTTPEEIEALEGELLGVNPVHIHVKHGFCKGIATRQITIPKGTLAIGHGHSGECMNIVTAGSVSVVIDGEVKRISAPACFVSPPFARKIGYVHEDLTWITVHATNETSIDELERQLIIKSDTFRRYEEAKGPECTEIANCPRDEYWVDRIDYFNFLKEVGISHEEARKITENTEDQVEFAPGKGDGVYVGSSLIQGSGIFSAFDVKRGTILGAARIAGKRTKIGRYTNHSRYPNCKFVADENGDIFIKTLIPLKEGAELTVDYRIAMRVAKAADKNLKLNTQ